MPTGRKDKLNKTIQMLIKKSFMKRQFSSNKKFSQHLKVLCTFNTIVSHIIGCEFSGADKIN